MTSKQLIASIAAAGSLLTGGVVNNAQLQAQDDVINPYVENVDNFEARVKANKVLVHKNEPKITLEKWNNKDSLSVSYSKKKANGKSNRKQLTKIIEYNVNAKESVVMEPTDDGFNIDINLSSKPTSNVFIYQFDNWQDKDFFYQPALNVEMASSTCTETDCGNSHRPENVVGSYAVYSKEKKNHITGQTNYQTGKLFHIYRPLVSDANGSTTWGTLHLADGVLTVAVPWEFLDSASYPVLVDPTFGYTGVGASTAAVGTGLVANPPGLLGTLIEAGDITKITVYGRITILAKSVASKLYSGSAGSRGSLLATTDNTSVDTSFAWYDFTFASPYSASATTYWLHWNSYGGDGPVTPVGQIKYDGGGAANTSYNTSDGGSLVYGSQQFSIYATYTADTPASASTTLINIQSGTVKINSGKVIR